MATQTTEVRELTQMTIEGEYYDGRREVLASDCYSGAVAWVTDGTRYGVRYEDGQIDWIADDVASAYGEGIEVVES